MFHSIKIALMKFRDYFLTGVFRVLKRLDNFKKETSAHFDNVSLNLEKLQGAQNELSKQMNLNSQGQNELLNTLKQSKTLLAQGLDKQSKKLALYHLNAKFHSSAPKEVDKSSFLLFDYSNHSLLYDAYNLGDYLQTIATQNALESLFKGLKFSFFDRDHLSFYTSARKIPCVMQGWFAYGYDFLPSSDILPIFVGTHFTPGALNFLTQALIECPHLFKDLEIGCRDKFTLQFCQNYELKSYFSRCLSLTLPKRKASNSQKKVFFVDVPKDFLEFIPEHLKENAQFVSQGLKLASKTHWSHYQSAMQALLKRYENEASLIITDRLHCASPCTALGIPVIWIRRSEEQKDRFSALDGILRAYTLEDFKNNDVDFSPKAPDIEPLKEDMLENLRLSILKAFGENVSEAKLLQIRGKIANFNCLQV